MTKKKVATGTKKRKSTSRLSLNELLTAAKDHWTEGSLHEEAVEAERAGTLQPCSDRSTIRDVPILLKTPGWLPPERQYEYKHVDCWDFDSEYSDASEDAEFGTEAAFVICDVVTADAGTLRIAIYEDNFKRSIDRVPDDATVPDVCRLWVQRWDGEVPRWVTNFVEQSDRAAKERRVQVSFTSNETELHAFGSISANGHLSREECKELCRGLLEELYEKHGHEPDGNEDLKSVNAFRRISYTER